MIGVAVRGGGPVEELVRALEPLRTDREPNHNYSVWLSDDRRLFHRLQWGGCTVVRTRDPHRLARALAAHFGGHGPPPAGLLRTDGVMACHGSRATVLPPSLRQSIAKYERPLRDAGVVLSDAPWVDLDPRTGDVVLQPPPPWAARFGPVVDRLPPPDRPQPMVEPGRYALAGWFFDSIGFDEEPMSITDAVATVLSGLRSPLTGDDQAAAVAEMFGRMAFGRMLSWTPRELLERMTL